MIEPIIQQPLEGLRVIELGQLIAGPFCGQLLGDFGAEIIKVEAGDRPDPARDWGAAKVNGQSLFWPIIARNKKSLTINLRLEAGQAILKRLVGTADVLIENFRPGTLEKWNLSPEVLHAINPRLVIVRVSGYGQTGPESHKPGYASVGEAKAGLRYLIGEPDRPPARAGVSLGDTMTGTFAALGAMMALFSREKTGRGQVVDAAIYESVMAFMESVIPEYALAGHTRERTGAILPKVAPSSAYPCRDGMVIIGANQDTLFQRLAKMMDKDWGTDERFATHNARGDNQTELDEMISEWTSARSVKDVLSACNANAVPCGPVNTAKDMLEDAHIKARNAIVKLFAPLIGADVPMQAPVPKLSATPGRVNSAGPALGEHTDAILDVLGYSDADRERLRNDNVI
ncbi:MAG: CaiB/BaiF CoA-transferase family protein [Henriciella sp.]|jgi:crotonobetainyl-CoA:carnitine CoA-transferase CaiB-like acyl-CoA transferase